MRHRVLHPLVLALACLAWAPIARAVAPQKERVSQDAIDAAIQRGIAFLLERQGPDGGWQAPRAGVTALAAYALLKSGIDPGHAAVQRAFMRLGFDEPQHTYDVACMIMALAATDTVNEAGWIQDLADRLVSWQEPQGWGYPGGGDLSNTQYAALGLRAAALSGAEVPERVWHDLAKSLERYSDKEGGYGYRGGRGSSGSMTCAGLGTLAICDAMLTRLGKITRRQMGGFAERKENSAEWLAKHFTVTRNPGGNGWLFYYLYGLERVGALAGLRTIGEHDWYAEGAAFLVRSQGSEGAWASNVNDTAFALLFLSRATSSPVTGGVQGGQARRYGAQGAKAAVRVAATGDTPLTLWITGFSDAALEGLEWPGEEGRGPRVLRVVYRMGAHPIGVVPGDRGRPMDDARFVYRHRFREPGIYALRAGVEVLTPRRQGANGHVLPGEIRVLESPVFEVQIHDVEPDWLARNRSDAERNLIAPGGVRARATSSSPGGNGLPEIEFGPHMASTLR